MFIYNLKIAWRNFYKNRSNTVINLSSLVVGFTCLTLIAFWLQYELSFDTFHEKGERTYRIVYHGVLMGKEINDAQTSKSFNHFLLSQFPEVETATIISNFQNGLVTKSDGKAYGTKLRGINPNFFDVFSVKVISGNINDLDKPNTAFISKDMSRKFFGDENPIGKVVSTGMDREDKKFTIAGVVENMPEKSHFDFDMLYSNTSQSWYNNENDFWLDAVFYNYVVLKLNIDYKAFEQKFNNYVTEKVAATIKNWKNISLEEWSASGDWVKFELQPMADIHLNSSLNSEFRQNGSILYVYIFLVVGLLILIISVINFSNLSTVRSLGRSKEIGVRKVSGSSRKSLIFQFLLESCVLSLVALFISGFIVSMVSPYYQNFSGLDIWSQNNSLPWIIIGMLLIAIFAGLLGGVFPSLVLSKLSPVKALASSGKIKFNGIFLKDVLIVAQFAISIAVIIGTLFISRQLDYLQNKSLGFNKDNILILKGTENLSIQDNLLLNEKLQKLSCVQYSTSSNYIPNGDIEYHLVGYKTNNKIEETIISFLPCDYNFKDVYQLNILKGSFFNKEFSSEPRKIVLNEKAVQKMGMKDCIGKTIRRGKTNYEIVGVVKDFHFNSKHFEIAPLGLVQMPDVFEFWPPLYCSVLLKNTNAMDAIADIEKIWKEVAGSSEFNFAFFDQEYDKMYKQEKQTKKAFVLFSFIVIALSCFGLFGFVKYTIQIRTKEIGIRKVNGAKNKVIFLMLTKYFIKPVMVAFIIASPIAWYVVSRWLQSFAYRIEISLLYFVLAGFITILIVFLTVGWLSWRTAGRNPVEALKYE